MQNTAGGKLDIAASRTIHARAYTLPDKYRPEGYYAGGPSTGWCKDYPGRR